MQKIKKIWKWTVLAVTAAIVLGVIALPIFVPLRPRWEEKLGTALQPETAWRTQDGSLIYQTDADYNNEGYFDTGKETLAIWPSSDITGSWFFVYTPMYTPDGRPCTSEETRLEKWAFEAKGEDWVILRVEESVRYEPGTVITLVKIPYEETP